MNFGGRNSPSAVRMKEGARPMLLLPPKPEEQLHQAQEATLAVFNSARLDGAIKTHNASRAAAREEGSKEPLCLRPPLQGLELLGRGRRYRYKQTLHTSDSPAPASAPRLLALAARDVREDLQLVHDTPAPIDTTPCSFSSARGWSGSGLGSDNVREAQHKRR